MVGTGLRRERVGGSGVASSVERERVEEDGESVFSVFPCGEGESVREDGTSEGCLK